MGTPSVHLRSSDKDADRRASIRQQLPRRPANGYGSSQYRHIEELLEICDKQERQILQLKRNQCRCD